MKGYVFHEHGEPYKALRVQRSFKKVLKAASITNFTWHDLRHCYCSYMRQVGESLDMIGIMAGQRDLRMAKRYSHLNVENLRAAVASLEKIITLLAHSDSEKPEKEIILENKG